MFIFPMAGLSNRFRAAGYTVPKYMLPAGDRSLFEHSISGFRRYFEAETFLFVYLASEVGRDFILNGCNRRGIPRRHTVLIELREPTSGQASTVKMGLEMAQVGTSEPITIFNVDSTYRSFTKPSFDLSEDVAGYLDVFAGTGDHWSFVRPAEEVPPGRRASSWKFGKGRISDLCSTGLYHFGSAEFFERLCGQREARSTRCGGRGSSGTWRHSTII